MSVPLQSAFDTVLVTSITEKQRTYDGMLEELSVRIASVDVVDDLQGR